MGFHFRVPPKERGRRRWSGRCPPCQARPALRRSGRSRCYTTRGRVTAFCCSISCRMLRSGGARLKGARCHQVMDGERRRGRGRARGPDRPMRGRWGITAPGGPSRDPRGRKRAADAGERWSRRSAASPLGGCLWPARGQATGGLYSGSAPCGEAFRIARPVCLPQAALRLHAYTGASATLCVMSPLPAEGQGLIRGTPRAGCHPIR